MINGRGLKGMLLAHILLKLCCDRGVAIIASLDQLFDWVLPHLAVDFQLDCICCSYLFESGSISGRQQNQLLILCQFWLNKCGNKALLRLLRCHQYCFFLSCYLLWAQKVNQLWWGFFSLINCFLKIIFKSLLWHLTVRLLIF